MTAYRHDLDAAHLRIAYLEQQLAESKLDEEESEPPTLRAPTPPPVAAPSPADASTRELAALIKSELDLRESKSSDTVDDYSTSKSKRRSKRLPLWEYWPIPALAILIAVYSIANAQGAFSSLEFGSLTSTAIVSGFLGVAIMLLRLAIRLITNRPTAADRLLMVLAGVVALPFILTAGIALMSIAGVVIGAGSLFSGGYGALTWAYGFIKTGSSD